MRLNKKTKKIYAIETAFETKQRCCEFDVDFVCFLYVECFTLCNLHDEHVYGVRQ